MDSLHPWIRIETQGDPVYVFPEKPDWFVPNKEADQCLQLLADSETTDRAAARLAESTSIPLSRALLEMERLHGQVQSDPARTYNGRADVLTLSNLKECWFHLTNRCNLACSHCLFGASSDCAETLPNHLLEKGLAEAKSLGCNLFFFTGGEPFLYPDFPSVLATVLADPASHAVVLTNGLLLAKNLEALAALPKNRLHIQVSLDGPEANHDQLRGAGSYRKLMDNLAAMRTADLPVTLSVAVNSANYQELEAMVSLAAENGVTNLHLLWHFVRGKGSRDQFVDPEHILPRLIAAQERAEELGVTIDNVETMRGQIFSTPGTRHDLSNTGWESMAVGPDGSIFPSPALVDITELRCGHLDEGLEQVWRTSPVLAQIRQASVTNDTRLQDDPLKFLVGGGDIDHSFLAGGDFVGHDPYLPLYRALALWLIERQAQKYPKHPGPHLLLRMGDVRHDCPEEGGHEVALTHCNCVVSLSADGGHSSVREFYGQAAQAANTEIQNPFAPAQAQADFIPDNSKQRSYGCGSPVQDAKPVTGEVLVDLGSGSGVECFMAAKAVGPRGQVFGIDMTDAMLELARDSQQQVAAKLGYNNLEFKKGFLENIPLPENTADAVISNCVINLSPDKRQTFHEVFRILKPGGRMVISDIVTDGPIPTRIKNDARFRGECLGGALQQEALIAMLRAVGFTGVYLIKRFPYRKESGVDFFSLTFSCSKPLTEEKVEVIYPGPFAAITTEEGDLLLQGQRIQISSQAAKGLGDSLMVLNKAGGVVNMPMTESCCGSSSTMPIMTSLPKAGTDIGCCNIPSKKEE